MQCDGWEKIAAHSLTTTLSDSERLWERPHYYHHRFLYLCIMEESQRQKKIAGILQGDISQVLQDKMRENAVKNLLVSVTRVTVTPDLGYAKVYVSVFPADKAAGVVNEIIEMTGDIRYDVAAKVRHQFRRMPELQFFNDDSLEYMDQIDKELKGQNNPIENPDILPRRKKS
jgi:ribosome-binding factor A